ncbi:MAG: aldehyde ferredoxin oxidoreductase family protein [Chloroflexi bacterium]|nr:aldehyde ferredoxin oxidoreductase family protein [Chloroflexota bacterium]
MFGWAGTVLRVDLTSGKVEKAPLSDYLRLNYLGGRGLNTRILYEETGPNTDPLGPENRLIFGSSPITGTMVASSRVNVSGKSPLTGILGDSNAGGHFGAELKFAGYDHIVISGRAPKPVYLWINNDTVELRDAGHLWGKSTEETDDIIKQEVGDPGTVLAYIGPAGENLVRVATVINSEHCACGRTGMGAVMGSKNLKAVAVRGTRGVKVADPEGCRNLAKELQERLVHNMRYPTFSIYGTTELFDKERKVAPFPIKNIQEADTSDRFEALRHEAMKKKFGVKNRACFGCANHCQHFWEIKEGPYAGEKGGKVEFATQLYFGLLCDNTDPASILKAHKLCNQYGLDVGEVGQLIAAAMEWYQRGLISREDTGGIELDWGDYEAIIEMVHQLGRREGFGAVLGEGVLRAAAKVGNGALNYVSHSKGILATAGGDSLRANKAYQLGLATSTRGADHLRGALAYRPGVFLPSDSLWKGPKVGPMSSYDEQAGGVRYITTIATMADTLEICKFNTVRVGQEIGLKEMAALVTVTTGVKTDEAALQDIADRIWLVERSYLVREGITRKDDAIFGRVTNEPGVAEPYKGLKHDPDGWDRMLDEFYGLMGLDKNGIPTRSRLESLGLKDVADELARMGKLS